MTSAPTNAYQRGPAPDVTGRTASDTGGLLIPPERALHSRHLGGVDAAGTMKIGEVAERLGLSLRSIRYYEETGLVTPASRTAGGFRLYSELDVQRLLLIMQMKPLEFSLEEMGQVLVDLDLLAGSTPVGDAEAVTAAYRRLQVVEADMAQRWALLERRLLIASAFRDYLTQELADHRPTDDT